MEYSARRERNQIVKSWRDLYRRDGLLNRRIINVKRVVKYKKADKKQKLHKKNRKPFTSKLKEITRKNLITAYYQETR